MEVGRFTFHRRALMAFDALSPDDQAAVLSGLRFFSRLPLRDWPFPLMKELEENSGIFLVQLDDTWRAIIIETEGQEPEVLDLVRQETPKTFANAGRSGRE